LVTGPDYLRIATLDRKLESFVCLADDARAQATAADREIAHSMRPVQGQRCNSSTNDQTM
jgi:hypothetical protein